ncbi:MAG: hypothetical protein KZQ83_00740 [gamma proteobacterium symbiont of Taylorina sp.]|nr:hypothetical protein [gamma proteobacterium symbiont of Taylorina sp.]
MLNIRQILLLAILYLFLDAGVLANENVQNSSDALTTPIAKRSYQISSSFPFPDDFNDYLGLQAKKAFAIAFDCGGNASYGWSARYNEQYSASQSALDWCNTYKAEFNITGSCFIFAEGNSVVSNVSFDCLNDGSDTPDTGTPDTGTPDTGTPDTGTPDTGTPDIGTPDIGTPDITEIINSSFSNSISTPYVVADDVGSALIVTPISVDVTHISIPEVHIVITGENDEITLIDSENTKLTIKPDTLLIQHPKQLEDTQTTKKVSLLKGSIELEVPITFREYTVTTPVVDIVVAGYQTIPDSQHTDDPEGIGGSLADLLDIINGTVKKISLFLDTSDTSDTSETSEPSNFSASYSQNGLVGTTTVSVDSGTVEVTDRENKSTTTLTAGGEQTIQSRVPRTSWVSPVDNDKIYGGKSNLLIWTEFPGAKSYLLEFNLPVPKFSEDNVSRPEFEKQSVPLPSTSYTEYDNLILFSLPLPEGLDGIILEVRIFALDVSGQIIGESVSSDRSTVTITD